ncbi:MAG: hypothetical protein HY332_14805 [Chloroflexi bacterium]|nr:hypothetical protein [Chloroflexota bacterium]
MEADSKGDRRGRGLGVLRKHKLAAQTLVVLPGLLGALAHTGLVWSRAWLAKGPPTCRGAASSASLSQGATRVPEPGP